MAVVCRSRWGARREPRPVRTLARVRRGTRQCCQDARASEPDPEAALALGLSRQVPRRETIAVPGRAPRNTGTFRFVSRAASARRRDERLRPSEVALIEVLRDWNALVEIPPDTAIERIADLAGAVRSASIASCVPRRPSRPVSVNGFGAFGAGPANGRGWRPARPQ